MAINGLCKQMDQGKEDLIVYFGDDREKIDELRKRGIVSSILMISGFDWNRHLSPWPAERIFKKGEDFAGEADRLVEEVLGLAELKECRGKLYCAGYSLAGLFALYLCTKTDCFDGCVSASGSLWYPGFTEYLKEYPVQCDKVYLSLGDKEKKTKNPRMASVENCTMEVLQTLQGYTDAVFEMNEGNHFADPMGRVAKGMHFLEVANGK